jgi:hypothetical protein
MMGRRRRTAKDLKLPCTWLVRRNLRSFAVLRRDSTLREVIDVGARLRLSQDDTSHTDSRNDGTITAA